MNKSVIEQWFDMFVKLVVTIFLFSSIYILIFMGIEAEVSIKYIWGVFGISLSLSLARIPFFYEWNMGKFAVIVFNVIYALFANAVVLFVGSFLRWFNFKQPATIIGIEITFVLVFVVVWLIIWISMKHSEQKLNNQLKKIKGGE